jgi:predicted HicB family RNase H-like nuclease
MLARKRSQKKGPAPISKTPKLLRLTDETARRLAQAAANAGMSEAVYTEQALKDRFKKDGIA